MFEPFFTTKDVGHGTGLGLDTARRIVQERHGGTLSLDSGEPGHHFTVWLPFAQAPSTGAARDGSEITTIREAVAAFRRQARSLGDRRRRSSSRSPSVRRSGPPGWARRRRRRRTSSSPIPSANGRSTSTSSTSARSTSAGDGSSWPSPGHTAPTTRIPASLDLINFSPVEALAVLAARRAGRRRPRRRSARASSACRLSAGPTGDDAGDRLPDGRRLRMDALPDSHGLSTPFALLPVDLAQPPPPSLQKRALLARDHQHALRPGPPHVPKETRPTSPAPRRQGPSSVRSLPTSLAGLPAAGAEGRRARKVGGCPAPLRRSPDPFHVVVGSPEPFRVVDRRRRRGRPRSRPRASRARSRRAST